VGPVKDYAHEPIIDEDTFTQAQAAHYPKGLRAARARSGRLCEHGGPLAEHAPLCTLATFVSALR
jgi:hypothetical protein